MGPARLAKERLAEKRSAKSDPRVSKFDTPTCIFSARESVLLDAEGYYAPFFVAAGPGQDDGASVSGEVLWLEGGLVGFELEGWFSG